MGYENLKNQIKQKKQTFTAVAGGIIIFLLGFGAGRGVGPPTAAAPPIRQTHYATPSEKSPANASTKKSEPKTEKKTTPSDPKNCIIKGNISAKGDKVYHVKGGSFYERTQPEQCFNTEAEAKAAGFRKSSR